MHFVRYTVYTYIYIYSNTIHVYFGVMMGANWLVMTQNTGIKSVMKNAL